MNGQVCRIAVFGEMLVDQFEAGPVVGGAPFNVARHLAAFGHAPLMRADGGHQFVIRTGCAWDAIEDEAAGAAIATLDPQGWLYCGTLALRSTVSRATSLKLLRAHTGSKYLDLNWREGHVEHETALQAARLADVLKVNDEELEMLVDTVGAGDSFSAVVLCGLLRDWSMPVTLSRANAFAGHICEVQGAVPARLDDYASWTSGWEGN